MRKKSEYSGKVQPSRSTWLLFVNIYILTFAGVVNEMIPRGAWVGLISWSLLAR